MNNYMDNQMKLNNYIEGALMAALAAMIAIVGLYIAPLQIVTTFIWLVPIVVVAVRRGFYTGILALVTTAVLLMILAPPWQAFIYLVQFGALGIVFSYCFSKQIAFAKTMMLGTIVVAVSTVITFFLNLLIMGLSIADLAVLFEEVKESTLIMYENMGLLDRMQEQGIDIEETLANSLALVIRLIPATMVIIGMSVAFITYFIARKTLQKLNLEVTELPMFRHWQIPWYFIWGVIVGLGFVIYGDFAGWETGTTIGMNIMYMFFPILLIQGLAVFVFYYYKWEISPLLKILLLVIIVVGFPYAIMILLVTGLFDPLFNYRRLDLDKS